MADEAKCPLCGSETTLRTVKKGPDVGRKFYVCNKFPKCTGRVDYRIQCKLDELENLKEQYEEKVQAERIETERYKEKQLLELEKLKAEQIAENERLREEIRLSLANDRADFQIYKMDKEQIFKNETKRLQELENKYEEINRNERVKIESDKSALDQLIKEKTHGFPWLAKAYDDYLQLCDWKLIEYLQTKPHRAKKTAGKIEDQIAKERRAAEKAARIANNLLEYCRFLAPWLDDYIGIRAEELDSIIRDIHSSWEKKEEELEEDVKRHIGPRVWDTLTPTEKLQRELDWYWDRPNKTNWQLGRDYENYIGHLYENNGWAVYYHGSKGFEDLGRDLICKKDGCVEIIQCKYWAREKTVHENAVYYLFGTTVEYCIENFPGGETLKLSLIPEHIMKGQLTPRLITSTVISPKARQVSEILRVAIEENKPFERYPSVKCNVSRKTGEKIFHLPFDQQYDKILIEDEKSECYKWTVAEAENLGFRHAKWWMGGEPGETTKAI